MNLNDLYEAAKSEDVDVTAAPSNRTELTDGETYVVVPELVRAKGKNEKGTTTFSVMFRVLDGPDNVNRVYWDNFYISPKETAKAFNARVFHYLSVVGLPIEVLSASEEEAVLTAAAAGTKVTVTAAYDVVGDKTFNRFHYEPLASATVTVDDEEESDFTY